MIDFKDLLLGWVLGIFSPLVVDRLQRRQRRNEFTRTVTHELRDLQHTLALAAYLLYTHLCVVKRDFLSWLLPLLEAYDGPERNPEMVETLRKHLARSDDELLAVWSARRTPDKAVRVVKYGLPFLDSQLNQLSECPMDFQRRVLEVRAQLDLFNAGVDLTQQLLMMTFDQSIAGDNRRTLERNLEDTYDKLANRAADMARAISDIRA